MLDYGAQRKGGFPERAELVLASNWCWEEPEYCFLVRRKDRWTPRELDGRDGQLV